MPTPKVQARINPAIPMVKATIIEVVISFLNTDHTLRKLTSPNAMARTNVEVICVPLLPPVPINNGIKKAKEIAASSLSSKACNTVLV